MSDVALEFDQIWKKFRKGEKYDSLRDLIPAMTKRVFSGNHRGELEKTEFWALKDVSFEVKRGEALGIIGPNGAGKSTILKLLSGILKPNKGKIKVNGRLSALIEVAAGFHQDLTGKENIYLNGAVLGMKRSEVEKKFDEIVEFSGISEFIDTPVKRYSSGMYARLGFSVASHLDPDILLVDEVLAVGDISFQAKCIEKIKKMKESNATIVFISHNLGAVLDLCPRTILLNRGEVSADGFTENVIKEYREAVSQKRATQTTRSDRGHSPINIRSIFFLDHDGHEKLAFERGEKMVIRIILEAVQKIANPVLGLAFYDEKGVCVYGHNSKVDKYDLGDVYNTYGIDVEYNSMELQPGNYFVSVGVYDSMALKPYEYKDKGYSFMMTGGKGEIGLIHLPHKWQANASAKQV